MINLMPWRAQRARRNLKRRICLAFCLWLLLSAGLGYQIWQMQGTFSLVSQQQQQWTLKAAKQQKKYRQLQQLEQKIAALQSFRQNHIAPLIKRKKALLRLLVLLKKWPSFIQFENLMLSKSNISIRAVANREQAVSALIAELSALPGFVDMHDIKLNSEQNEHINGITTASVFNVELKANYE